MPRHPPSTGSRSTASPPHSGRDDDMYHHPPPHAHTAMRVGESSDDDEDDDDAGYNALNRHVYNDADADEEEADIEEREPLMRSSRVSGGPTSSAVSPSTGSNSSLRRNLRLVPFCLENVSDAVWTYFHNYKETPHDCLDEQAIASSDFLERGAVMDIKLDRFTGSARVKFAVQRHVDTHYAVVVWVALIDPSDALPRHLSSLVLKQTGWIAARPASPTDALTEVVTAMLTVPEYYAAVSLRKRRSSTVANYLIGSVTSQLDVANDIIDNLLMGCAVKKRD